jgi:L-aminopeptidase/D-esterase-like protein
MSMHLAMAVGMARRGPARLAAPVLGAALAVLTASAAASGQRPGPSNTITDVPGIKVGHETRIGGGYRTGTTVILTERGATASFSQLGGAPGTKEVALLEPGGLVTQVNAIVLSGGSAYGLDAATGVMRWLEEHGYGFPVPGGVVPIVPAAILFDLGRGGDFKARPDAEFGYRAAAAATSDPVKMGRVGAGTGARHGLGSASVVLPNGYTVGAIVALNPAGSVVNPQTCLPYGVFLELDGEFGLVQPPPEECHPAGSDGLETGGEPDDQPFNTTIAVVATDAPLDQTQAKRMAMVANTGLARAIKPVHGLRDGDLIFAVATSPPDPNLSLRDLEAIYNAAADVLGRAVVHALLNAESVGETKGYCDRYPSACRNRKSAARSPAGR